MAEQLAAAPGAAHDGVAAAGEAVDPSAAALELIHGLGDRSADRMAELTERKRALKQERADVAKQIKAEARKRKKIMEKAKTLSDAELMAVLAARGAAAKAKAQAKAKAKAKAQVQVQE